MNVFTLCRIYSIIYGVLIRLQPISDDKPVASLLMSFSRGCASLLQLMQNEDSNSPCSSDGYHSETEPETEREYGKY